MIKEPSGLPYKAITGVANRETIRQHTMRGRETYFIDFKLLKIRDGFNLRKEYIEIPELADFIEVNGLPAPMVVDMLDNGHCYIEQGHRRFKALELLKEKGVFKSLELTGLKTGKVECFVNHRDTDELTRIKRQYSSNNGEKYTTLELGELCTRLFTVFNLSQVEIARELGMSRQNVKNMMIIAEQPGHIKEAIKNHNITPTAAIDLSRKIKDADKRNDIVQEAVSKMGKVSVGDVRRIVGDKDLKEIPKVPDDVAEELEKLEVFNEAVKKDFADQFDKSRAEIGLCNRVIKNADKINQMVAGLENEQLRADINTYIGFIQNDMEDIRMYVHKNKKQ